MRDAVDALALDFVLHHGGEHRVVDGEGHSTMGSSGESALVHILNDQVVDVDAAHHVHGVIVQTLDQLAANDISHIL